MIKGDFAPGFYVKHFIKDMTIAIESAEELGFSTLGLALSLELYQELASMGEKDSGTQELIKLFDSYTLSCCKYKYEVKDVYSFASRFSILFCTIKAKSSFPNNCRTCITTPSSITSASSFGTVCSIASINS